jgi:small subunit ribosomal protein S14
MARKSLFAREAKRKTLYLKFKEKREALKKEGKYDELQSLPRNSSLIRQRNRCVVTGRQRAFMRKFGLSRLVFREKALRGEIPGVKKASW